MEKKALTFKGLVNLISNIRKDEKALLTAQSEVCYSFEHQKITWADYEALWRILGAYAVAQER